MCRPRDNPSPAYYSRMRQLSATTLCLALAAAPLSAQVGHPPGRSPYRDIVHGKSLTAMYGDVGGTGGQIGVGPHDGRSYGVRFDIRVGTPLQFGLTLARANLKRLIVSADDSVSNRVDGPVDQRLTMVEGALQLNLTGKKTWNHLAPFLAGTIGYVGGSGLPASEPDSSGYKFGSKFYFAPAAGVRVFFGRSLHLRLEARQLFWKLTYPSSYLVEPAAQPSTDPAKPNAVLTGPKLTEWTGGREFRLGLGVNF
jgi:hypothetical protein